MITLKTNELLELTIFKCKVCTRRLQRPIIQLGSFGNVCGSCYEKSVFTNGIENIEMETFLSKLHVRCRYEDRGCKEEAPYVWTGLHERKCEFRDRICPFSFQNLCDNNHIYYPDIINHIETFHKDYILKAENNIVTIQNPIYVTCEIFYLLIVKHNKKFLIRTRYDAKKQLLLYAFYYFNSNLNEVNFKFLQKRDKLCVKSKQIAPMHESEISYEFDYENALQIKRSVSEIFGCWKYIKISIILTKEMKQKMSLELLKCFKCVICKNYSENHIYECRCADLTYCGDCTNELDKCPECYFGYRPTRFDHFLNLDIKFPCKNTGCNEHTRITKYNLHNASCSFKQYRCTSITNDITCIWRGLYENIFLHLLNAHPNLINTTLHISTYINDQFNSIILMKQNIILKCTYKASIKVLIFNMEFFGPTYLSQIFTWELHISEEDTSKKMVITGECVPYALEKHVNISNYITRKNTLELFFYIKYKNNKVMQN